MKQVAKETQDMPLYEEYAPLKKGMYDLTIERVKFGPTRNGDGQLITLGLTSPSGRYVWEHLNVENPNPRAVEISRRKLVQLLHECGITAEQFGKDMNAIVGSTVRAFVSVNDQNQNRISFFGDRPA